MIFDFLLKKNVQTRFKKIFIHSQYVILFSFICNMFIMSDKATAKLIVGNSLNELCSHIVSGIASHDASLYRDNEPVSEQEEFYENQIIGVCKSTLDLNPDLDIDYPSANEGFASATAESTKFLLNSNLFQLQLLRNRH